ncbi:hypothetical protein [Streptococcus dysgalactiae]|uniref:hypothetical protein n=1 Tax=Streptococcus dysgalactiae TaxID=1334 RepID=UPI003D72CF1A
MKRIMAANDLVGIGKVGLSASIPVMAACCMEQALFTDLSLIGAYRWEKQACEMENFRFREGFFNKVKR